MLSWFPRRVDRPGIETYTLMREPESNDFCRTDPEPRPSVTPFLGGLASVMGPGLPALSADIALVCMRFGSVDLGGRCPRAESRADRRCRALRGSALSHPIRRLITVTARSVRLRERAASELDRAADCYLGKASAEVALRFVDVVERAVARSAGHRNWRACDSPTSWRFSVCEPAR